MLILWSVGRPFANFTRELDTVEFCVQRQSDELLAPGPIEGIGTGKPRSSGRQGGGHFKNEACRPAKILSRTTSTVFIHPWQKAALSFVFICGSNKKYVGFGSLLKLNTHRLSSPFIAPNTGFDGWVNVFKEVPYEILPFLQVDNRIKFL